MALDPVTAGIGLFTDVIDKIFPNADDAAKAKLALAQLQQNGQLAELTAATDLAKGQMSVNSIEAASSSFFTSGWRPFIGWTCGASLALIYCPFAIMQTIMWVVGSYHIGAPLPRPDLGLTDLLGLLGPMLGLSGLRTAEKFKGVAN